MNPVDHSHGGGNHQHIGHSSTVKRSSVPGQKVSLEGEFERLYVGENCCADFQLLSHLLPISLVLSLPEDPVLSEVPSSSARLKCFNPFNQLWEFYSRERWSNWLEWGRIGDRDQRKPQVSPIYSQVLPFIFFFSCSLKYHFLCTKC